MSYNLKNFINVPFAFFQTRIDNRLVSKMIKYFFRLNFFCHVDEYELYIFIKGVNNSSKIG